MRKIILIFSLLIIMNPLFAEMIDYKTTFSISTSISIMYGSINEYAFDDKGKVSELRWEMKPLLLAGTKIAGSIGNFKLEGNLLYALNEDTGLIRDYDWNTSTGKFTNFSKHNIKQNGSVFSDLYTSYMFIIDENFSLYPGAGIKYNNIQLTAEDGYLEYPPGSSREKFYGKGIIYEQKYLIPFLGAGVQYREDQFNISLSFFYSQFARCYARDSHLRREIDFFDEIKNARYYNLKVNGEYNINDKTSVSLNCGWTYIPLSKGSSYYIDLSTGVVSQEFKNRGGVKTEYIDAALSINLYL